MKAQLQSDSMGGRLTRSRSDILSAKFRTRRFKVFRDALSAFPSPVRIIDVGGTEAYWLSQDFGNKSEYQITLVNVVPETVRCSNMVAIAGDATDLSQFKDKQFDIAFSNSVIEHLHTKDNQRRMASEVMRVGRHYFVQTPNKYFPIEPHYQLPMFQFLPGSIIYPILTRTKLSCSRQWKPEYATQYINELRLLSLKELRELFPGSRIYYEKVLFLNKSFTAHNLPNARA